MPLGRECACELNPSCSKLISQHYQISGTHLYLIIKMKSKYIEAWNYIEVYIIHMTTYVCKQRVVALLLMELLSKMRKMQTITPPDAISLWSNSVPPITKPCSAAKVSYQSTTRVNLSFESACRLCLPIVPGKAAVSLPTFSLRSPINISISCLGTVRKTSLRSP